MKKLLTVMLSVLLVLSFAGCKKEEPKGPVTVTIWHTYTEAQKEYLEKAAADFNASQSEVIVEVLSQEYSGFSDSCYQAVMAGNGPDIIIHYASEAALYVEDGKVADLGAYLPKELIGALTDGAKEEATSFADGKMHVFPIVFSGPVLFYNPDLLEAAGVEVPQTWDEVMEASKTISEKVTVDENKNVKTDGTGSHVYGFAVDSATDVAQTMMMQLGATIFDTEKNQCGFDTPEVRNALQWYADGVTSDVFLANPTLSNYFSDNYNTCTLAMYIGSVAGAPYLKANWKVAPLPQTEGGTPWTPAWNRGVIVFANGKEREAAACKFLEYFASAEVNAGWCVACNYQTSLKTTMENETYKNLLANSDTLNALQPETAGCFIAVPAIAYVRTALGNLMKAVGAGTPVEEAVKAAYDYVAGELE